MMHRLFVITCFFLLPAGRICQATPANDTLAKASNAIHIKLDTPKVNLRRFNAESINKYKTDPQYNYYQDQTNTDTWWDRFWRWIWHLLDQLFSSGERKSNSVPFGKYIAIAIAVGFVVYILIKILGLENILRRKSAEVSIAYAESLDNINLINFDEAIENHWKQRNYRLAVRLLYLRSLKQLNDARLINWQVGKTNTAYINEIGNDEQRKSFAVLTRQFEYVWYGDFPVDEHSYERINHLFTDFKKML